MLSNGGILIFIKTKLSVYEASVLTDLLYSSETWTTYRQDIKVLKRFHRACQRRILKTKWQSLTLDVNLDIIKRMHPVFTCFSYTLRYIGLSILLSWRMFGYLNRCFTKSHKSKKHHKYNLRVLSVDVKDSEPWQKIDQCEKIWSTMSVKHLKYEESNDPSWIVHFGNRIWPQSEHSL